MSLLALGLAPLLHLPAHALELARALYFFIRDVLLAAALLLLGQGWLGLAADLGCR